jgi:biopolymer transport protein ExbB
MGTRLLSGPRLAGVMLVALGAAAAGAQTSPAAPAPAAIGTSAEPTSFLQILLDGIEIPSYLIIAGSIAAIALIVEHFVSVRRTNIAPAHQVRRAREQIEHRAFRECLDSVRTSQTFFAQTMTAALQHARHGFDAMHEAAIEKAGELSGGMFRKAEYLNILGNLGPLLGLLGTVWGMIEAFGALGGTGGGGGDELAGGISKALVNTLLGLALAIVGIGFFGLARNRIDAQTSSATVAVLDLLEYFRPAASGGSGRSGERGSAKPALKPSQSPADGDA